MLLKISNDGSRVTSLLVSALLAGAGGYLDAFTYLAHGHVFANAMTGNVVLLGINLFLGSWLIALRHLPPILAFLLGTIVALAIQLHVQRRHARPHHTTILLFEIAIFLVLSFAPQSTSDFVITVSVAFAASIQAQTFREVNGKSFNSTFTTGNLRTLGEAVFVWLFEERNDNSFRVVRDFATICTCFLAGAITGGLVTGFAGNRALLFEVAMLTLVVILIRWFKHGDMIVHQER